MGRTKKTQCKSQRVFQKLNQERAWTSQEKETLLLGVQLHGTANYELLQSFAPRRSMTELKNFLQLHKLDGMWKPKVPGAEPPIDLWLNNLDAKEKNGCLNVSNSREIAQVKFLLAMKKLLYKNEANNLVKQNLFLPCQSFNFLLIFLDLRALNEKL
jgi:hypothetical protein